MVLTDIGDHHSTARGREYFCLTQAGAAPATGDKRNLARKVFHAALPLPQFSVDYGAKTPMATLSTRFNAASNAGGKRQNRQQNEAEGASAKSNDDRTGLASANR
jgi:hypothetical protein